MTRLRQPERRVLDTLVEGGVARSRSDALAWCVRLVGQHEDSWLAELRDRAAPGRGGPIRRPAELIRPGRKGKLKVFYYL